MVSVPSPPYRFLEQQPEIKTILAPAGTIISNTGDDCHSLIILKSGIVKVYRPAEDGRAITLYHIAENESCILTASCILNSQSFPAVAEVESDAQGLAIPADKMLSWLTSEPSWQQYLFSLLSQRMSDLISLVDALAFRKLDVRLAAWLLDNQNKSRKIFSTHQVIADELASSREVISRLLKEFENAGYLKLSRGQILLLRPEKILQIK